MLNLEELRWIDDNKAEYNGVLVRAENNAYMHRMHLLSNSLKVTEEITPRIFSVIKKI